MIADIRSQWKWVILVIFGVIMLCTSASAQVTEVQAREMLAQRGIPEDTLRARLIAKGINPDNINENDLERLQDVILETVEEIEADQKKRAGTKEEVKLTGSAPDKPAPAILPIAKTDSFPPKPVTEEIIPVYGQEIFRNNTLSAYQKVEELVVPDSYILGVGDKLGVVGFGRSQFEQILEVSQDGFVQPGDRLPKILLKGVRFGDAKEVLYQRYSQYHVISRNEFQVTLVKARNMTVNVFGEAVTTGSFTLPGINTAFNVISAAGGPTNLGSVRKIKVIRGKETIPLDVYEFMADPGVAKNYFLQNNDYIHIPVASKVVTIKGAVNRPMKYELLDEENLVQLLKYAGGATHNAYLSSVQITRYTNDKNFITNVNLKELASAGADYVLYSGDIVEIRTIGPGVENTVSINGAVAYPGSFERRENMRISNLLDMGVLRPDARLDFAYLLRYQPDSTFRFERIDLEKIKSSPGSGDDLLLNDRDQLKILTLKSFVEPGYFAVVGAVKEPDTFAFNPEGRMKLDEAIILAGGLDPDAADFGYIMRFDPKEPKSIEYIHLQIKEAVEDPFSKANITVRAGDQIHVYDKASRRDEVTVSIFGAVRNPGKYAFGPGMRMADLISLAGGFRFEADPQRIDVARSTIHGKDGVKVEQFTTGLSRDFESNYDTDTTLSLEPFDHIYVRTIPEYEMQRTVEVKGEVVYPGAYALLKDKERIYDLVVRAGGLTGQAFPEGAKLFREGDGTGLVVIDLHLIMNDQNNVSNITLREGDILEIPKSRELVTIGGYVNLDEAYGQGFLTGERSISVAFRGEKSAKYYVDKFAAGISQEGSQGEIKVQYADGRVQKTRKFLFFNNYPNIKKGSYITVGPKKVKATVEKEKKDTDWGAVLRDTMYQATAVLTLLILVDELAN